MQVITVGELNRYIKQKIESDSLMTGICVRGEISNFKHHYTGHMYMSLKDDTGSIRAVMFRSAASRIAFVPQNGMMVMVTGRVGVFERDGQYQIYIDYMVPDGIGQLYAAYEQLKSELEADGYFSAEHKRPISKYPMSIGVATAPNGAAVRDIINIVSRRYPLAKVMVYPTLVQGGEAAQSICGAIEYFNSHTNADVLIVGRGGGSIEDLWPFNDRNVAMAIYNSGIPVISAVGHETDFTIADFVADLRAPTPSAAAELSTPSAAELAAWLCAARERLRVSLARLAESKRALLKSLMSRRIFLQPELMLEQKTSLLDSTVSSLAAAYTARGDELSKRLCECSYKLSALNPIGVLARGYSVAYGDDGVLKSVSDFDGEKKFFLRVSDGSVECRSLGVKEETNGGKKL